MSERQKHDLSIHMPIDGFGDMDDLDWRHNLENAIDELLARTNNGECDGGETGSGSMNIGVFVYDFDTALEQIIPLLKQFGTPPGTTIIRSNLYQIFEDDANLDGLVKQVVWPQ